MIRYNEGQKYLFSSQNSKFKSMKNSTTNSSKKDFSIIDFIQQKNKFKIQDGFDEIETKKFLSSKENALKEIILNEDIEEIKNSVNNIILMEEKVQKNKKFRLSTKIRKEKSASPRRKKEKKKKNNNIKIVKTDSDKLKEKNKNITDIDDNKFIYKFIIYNADEPEDIFMSKLNQEIQKVESNKISKNKKEKSKINKKNYKLCINNKEILMKKDINLNPFNFSKKAKNLMINDDIEISEIDNHNTITPDKYKLNTIATYCTSNKRESTKINLYTEQEIPENNNNINNKDINDNESLLSILSDLMY